MVNGTSALIPILADTAAGFSTSGRPAANNHTWSQAAMAIAVHEAGHSVARFLLGTPVETTCVIARYDEDDGGDLRVSFSGYVGTHQPGYIPSIDNHPLRETDPPDERSNFCWRILLPKAIITAAGLIAEAIAALPHDADHGDGDRRDITNYSQRTWSFSGRDPHAFQRLAFIAARRALSSAPAWQAVEELADELVRRLRIAELRQEPTPGETLEVIIRQDESEAIMLDAGARKGALAHWRCCARCPPNPPRRLAPKAADAIFAHAQRRVAAYAEKRTDESRRGSVDTRLRVLPGEFATCGWGKARGKTLCKIF